MDPLSDVLSLLKPQNYLSAGMEAAGDWAIQFPDQTGTIKCGALVTGSCWLAVEGVDEPVFCATGDAFLLPAGRRFRLASDLAVPPRPASSVFPPAGRGAVVRVNRIEDGLPAETPQKETATGGAPESGGSNDKNCLIVSCRFGLAGQHAAFLTGLLPPIVHLREGAGKAALRTWVEGMMRELRDPQPGSSLITQHLAHMILVEALRLHVGATMNGATGWLFALADRQMGAALRAMHEEPGRRWTLEALAREAGISRASFALKFRQAVGQPPMDYLTRWRMLLASERLAARVEAVGSIALSLGYESESAFSTAFKRVMGRAPRKLEVKSSKQVD
jgi:AraC-like DNA-binding protein